MEPCLARRISGRDSKKERAGGTGVVSVLIVMVQEASRPGWKEGGGRGGANGGRWNVTAFQCRCAAALLLSIRSLDTEFKRAGRRARSASNTLIVIEE
jgi:hypothetical protein